MYYYYGIQSSDDWLFNITKLERRHQTTIIQVNISKKNIPQLFSQSVSPLDAD